MVGALTLSLPDMTQLVLFSLVAVWAVLTSVADIVAAVRLHEAIRGGGLLTLRALISVLFGLWLPLLAMSQREPVYGEPPWVTAEELTLLVGPYAFVAGAVLIAFAFQLRSYGRAKP